MSIAKRRSREARGWARALGVSAWCIVDTETTGLGADAEVVQVAVVDGQDGSVLLGRDVRPFRAAMDADAFSVHRLDAHRLASAAPWPQVYAEFARVLAHRRVVAYNADFDRRLLDQTCDLYDLPRLELGWECAMERYTEWGGRWRSLRAACAVEGIACRAGSPHSAVGDARLTWQLIRLIAGDGGPSPGRPDHTPILSTSPAWCPFSAR